MEKAPKHEKIEVYCRIQVRMTEEAFQGLNAYRAAHGDLTISEAVRRICRDARSLRRTSQGRSVYNRDLVPLSWIAEREEKRLHNLLASEAAHRMAPRDRMRLPTGNRPRKFFLKIFRNPRDIISASGWIGRRGTACMSIGSGGICRCRMRCGICA